MKHFNEILEYLHKESESPASIVGNAILDEIENLAVNPKIHPLDRFEKGNDGNLRLAGFTVTESLIT